MLFAGWDECSSGAAESGLNPTRGVVVGTAGLEPNAGPLFFKLPCCASGGDKWGSSGMQQ